jgi:hypothetical protein
VSTFGGELDLCPVDHFQRFTLFVIVLGREGDASPEYGAIVTGFGSYYFSSSRCGCF